MALRLIYLMFSKLLGWMVLRARSDTTNKIEILVLRHQLAMLRRRTPRPQISWTDHHEATADFRSPIDASWQRNWLRDLGGDDVVYGHCDTGPWNIVGRGGRPEAFIDWEFAGPVARSWELAETIWLNAQLHDDDIAERHGLPDVVGRARQVRAVLDGYGVSWTDRPMLVDRLAEVAIHGARAEAVAAEVRPQSTAAIDDEGYLVLWSIAWRARNASWIVRHRDLLRRHACQTS